jgi:hypothetical protein
MAPANQKPDRSTIYRRQVKANEVAAKKAKKKLENAKHRA